MADLAIAAEVNPNAGFDKLNSVIGLQSGMLGIQRARQALVGQAAEVQQAQMNTEAQAGTRDFFTNWSPGDHIAADGTTDIESAHGSDAYKGLSGLARTAVDQKLILIKQGQIQNASSLLGLNRDQLATGAQMLGGLAQDPDVVAGNENGKAKVQAAIGQWGQLGGPAGAKVAQIYSGITNGNPKPGELPQRIQALQKQALAADRQLQITAPGGGQAQTGGGLQTFNTNPYAGPQNPVGQPMGRPVANTMPPGIITYPTGQVGPAGGPYGMPGVGTGGGPAAGGAGTAASALPPNSPTPVVAAATATAVGGASDDKTRNDEISRSVAPSRQGIALADQISNIASQVQTGKFSKVVTDYAATIGQKDPAIAARQLLSKYAAQLKTLGIQNAASDNQRSQIEAGLPDPDTMNETAIRHAAEYIKGNMLMNLSRAANARDFQQTHGGTQGLRIADDQLTSKADPLMYTFQQTQPGSQERRDFISRHFATPEQFIEWKARMNAAEHYGSFRQ